MAGIELRREIDPAIQARFENLAGVNPARAEQLANDFNAGRLDASTFDREVTASIVEYNRITRATSAVPAAVQLHSVLPPAARALIAKADRIDRNDGDARGNFVTDIGKYVA